MAECIPSPGRTNGAVVWVQRSWPSERTLQEGSGRVGKPDRDIRGHWNRVAGLHRWHHLLQLQQFPQEKAYVENKTKGQTQCKPPSEMQKILYCIRRMWFALTKIKELQIRWPNTPWHATFSRHLNCIIKARFVYVFWVKMTDSQNRASKC